MITFDDMAHDGQMITRIIFPSLLGYLNIYQNIKTFNIIKTNHNVPIEA